MGYTVVPKPQVEVKAWVPDKELLAKYTGMTIAGINEEISRLVQEEKVLNQRAEEAWLKVIEYLEKQIPNEYSQRLYTGAMVGSRHQFTSKAVNVIIPKQEELTRQKQYLKVLVSQKEQENLITKLKELGVDATSIVIDQRIGSLRLVVELK